MFWFLGAKACGILAPGPRIEHSPPALEGKVPTTGGPGKSHKSLYWKNETSLHYAKTNLASDYCKAVCRFRLRSLGRKCKAKHINMDLKTKEDNNKIEQWKWCPFFLASICHFCQNRSNHRVDNFLKVSKLKLSLSLILFQFSKWTLKIALMWLSWINWNTKHISQQLKEKTDSISIIYGWARVHAFRSISNIRD